VPSCQDKECGDNGCGGNCGECESGYCQEGSCIELDATCSAAAAVGCDETVSGISNGMEGAVAAFESYSCQTFGSDDYSNGPEIVYEFTSEIDQVVFITGADDDALDVTVLKDEGEGCADSNTACLEQGLNNVAISAEAGETYYIVWDSSSSSTPIVADFGFTVTCCEPTGCDGSYCGDDGCGNNCGCDAGDVCNPDTETCGAAAAGDVCGAAFELDSVSLPTTVEGTTVGATDQYGYSAGKCPPETGGWGSNAPDVAYAFTPEETAEYHLSLTSEHDANLYIVSDCDNIDGSCLGGDEDIGSGLTEDFAVTLEGGVVYYIIVDGYGAGQAGTYSLTVGEPCSISCDGKTCGTNGCSGTCGTCELGESCDAGTCVEVATECAATAELTCGETFEGATNVGEGASFAFSGYTCEQAFGTADYEAGTEAIFTLTPSEDAVITISGVESGGLDVTVLEADETDACVDTEELCLANDNGEVTFSGQAGQPYYVIWDGPDTESFGIQVDCCITQVCDNDVCGTNCGEPCGCGDGTFCDFAGGVCGDEGDSCDAALTIVPGEEANGSNEELYGFTDKLTAAGCPGPGPATGDGDGQADVVYSLIPEQDGIHTISMPNYVSFAGPSLVYITGDCAGGCLAYADFFSDSPIEVALVGGTEYFIVVDSYGPTELGEFTLLVEGPDEE